VMRGSRRLVKANAQHLQATPKLDRKSRSSSAHRFSFC